MALSTSTSAASASLPLTVTTSTTLAPPTSAAGSKPSSPTKQVRIGQCWVVHPSRVRPSDGFLLCLCGGVRQLEELQEEVDYLNQMFHDLSVYSHGLKTELNEAKELLVKP